MIKSEDENRFLLDTNDMADNRDNRSISFAYELQLLLQSTTSLSNLSTCNIRSDLFLYQYLYYFDSQL